jgi:glycosyltransferase involved in cell wall biosynthesis
MNLSNCPFVSVIVPVFNQAEQLKLCLTALEQQTYPKSLYQVIVVDNGSDEDQNISAVVERFQQAIATCETLPGSYAARNRGMFLAKGPIIAFTDADCIPAANWIEQGVNYLLHTPNCGLVAGKIEIFFRDPQRVTAVELFESITAFPQAELLKQHRGGATANLFTFKQVIDQVGPFAAQMKSRGDLEWGQRVFACGYQQVYGEEACVAHPARYSLRQLYKRTIRLAGGLYDLEGKNSHSLLQRNQRFLQSLMLDLIPPLMFTFNAFMDPRLNRLDHKIKVSCVMFFTRYVTAWEKLRLKFGGVAARE